MPDFESYQDELDAIERANNAANATQYYAQTANPQTATNIASLADDYEWLPPGTAYALGAAGITGQSANAIAQTELQKQIEQNQFVNRAQRRKNRRKKEDDPGFWGGIWGTLKDIASIESPIDEVAKANKAVSRTAFTAMQTGSEAVTAALRMQAAIPDPTAMAAGGAPLTEAQRNAAESRFIGGEGGQRVRDAIAGAAKEYGVFGPYMAIAEQTVGGQAAIALAKGDKVDLGTGWFVDPESDVAKAQASAAREYSPYLIAGHAWTPGRASAGALFEPETAPFTILSGGVDAAMAIYADPAGLALGKVGNAMRAKKEFESIADAGSVIARFNQGLISREEMLQEAGAAVGRRPFVRKTNAVEYLFSQPGFDLVDTIRTTANPIDVWWGFNKKIPYSVAEQLADETDPGVIREILADAFGTTVKNVPKRWRSGTETNRWLIDIPDRTIDPDNIDASLRNIEGTLVSANVPEDRIRQVLTDVGRAHGRGDYYAAVRGVFDAIGAQMESYGLPREIVDEVTRMFNTIHGDANRYFVDALSGNDEVIYNVGGDFITSSSPMLDVERLGRGITMPSARELRAMTRRLEFLREGTTAANIGEVIGAGADVIMTDVWKPLVLLRPAWTIRVIGEEMLRTAVTGSGIFRHPISHLAVIMGDPTESFIARSLRGIAERQDPAWAAVESYYRSIGQSVPQSLIEQGPYAARIGAAIPGAKARIGRVSRNVFGQAFDPHADDDLGEALSQVTESIRRDQQLRGGRTVRRLMARDYAVVRRSDDIAHEGLVDELARLNADADIRRAREMTSDEFKLWGRTQEGIERRRYLSAGRQADDPMSLLETNADVFDQWVDNVYQRMNQITDGDAELLEAVRTGRIPAGQRLVDNDGEATQEALDWARGVLDDAQRLPNVEFLRAQRSLAVPLDRASRGLERLDSAVRTMFDYLMAKPTNMLNRSPEYRIKYWQEVENFAPNMNASARRRLLRNINDGSLGKLMPGQRERVIRALEGQAREGTMSLSQVDRLSKQRSLDHVRELLYDMGKKNQTADALRLIFPFGEAWKEILSTWAKLIAQYPQIPRRFQQAYQGAKEAEFDPNTGLPTGVGVGFLHYDPSRNEEVFTYPGSEFLTKKLLNVPIPLVGSAKGLNMIGTGIPGVGPAVQIPVSVLISDKPQWDGVRDIVFPFGQPDKKFSIDQFFLPAYLKKLITGINGPENDRIYMNTVFDVMRYLNSTGEYNLQGDDAITEMNRLYADGKEKAKWLYFVRVAAQASAPSAPAFDFQVEDKTGNLVMLQKVTDDWQKMRREARKNGGNDSDALDEFLDKYGADNIFAAQSKSRPLLPGLSSTTEQRSWERNNPGVVERYPQVWPLLAPEGKTFDQTAYAANIRMGRIDPLNAKDAAFDANQRLAELVYDRRKEELDSKPLKSADRSAALRDLRAQLLRDFPGYTGTVPQSLAASRIAELEKVAVDPELSKTPIGKALAEYFVVRGQGIVLAEQRGIAWPPTSEKSQWLQDGLQRAADSVLAKYPEFKRVWDYVLSREVEAN